jgi:hypothetical protein
MKAERLLLLSAALAAVSGPALADINNLGSVYIDTSSPATVRFADPFPAPLEYLGFTAPHGDVTCRSVWAQMADGSRHEVWRGGRVSHGGATAELPARPQAISSMEFRCSGTPQLVEIQILGDPGKYMRQWREYRDWNRWAHRVTPQVAPAQTIALGDENRS